MLVCARAHMLLLLAGHCINSIHAGAQYVGRTICLAIFQVRIKLKAAQQHPQTKCGACATCVSLLHIEHTHAHTHTHASIFTSALLCNTARIKSNGNCLPPTSHRLYHFPCSFASQRALAEKAIRLQCQIDHSPPPSPTSVGSYEQHVYKQSIVAAQTPWRQFAVHCLFAPSVRVCVCDVID